jgi:hypothetical protein
MRTVPDCIVDACLAYGWCKPWRQWQVSVENNKRYLPCLLFEILPFAVRQ